MTKKIQADNNIVYIAKYNGDVMYVGQGGPDRYKHITSGVSSVYEANRLHFKGEEVGVEIVSENLSKMESAELESKLIEKYLPPWNIVRHDNRNYRAEFSNFLSKFNFDNMVCSDRRQELAIKLLLLAHSNLNCRGQFNICRTEAMENYHFNAYNCSKYLKIAKNRKQSMYARYIEDIEWIRPDEYSITLTQYYLDNYRQICKGEIL